MGRADQTTKVRGMFVHPAQVAAIVARHPEIARAQLAVENPDGRDEMALVVELAPGRESSAEAIAATVRDVTKLRGEVRFVVPGALPNDGKVIDDRRRYD
jgi:phenylacetate-CoA ligase